MRLTGAPLTGDRSLMDNGDAVDRDRPPERWAVRAGGLLALAGVLSAVGGASCRGSGAGGTAVGGRAGGEAPGGGTGTGGTAGRGAGGDSTATGGTAGGGNARDGIAGSSSAGGGAGGSGAADSGNGGAQPVDGGLATDAGPEDGRAADLDGQGCGQVTTRNVGATNLPPDVLILFDRSGSMQEDLLGMTCPADGGAGDCGPNSKWSIATQVLNTFLPSTETTVNWGLKLFATGTSTTCSVSSTAEVPPGPSNAAAINAVLMQTVASSSTPTTAALRSAATYLKSFTDPSPKFILLVTDGVPTCGTSVCAPGVTTAIPPQCDDANAIAMVGTVHDEGIPVLVLGIGTSGAPGDATLSMMAVAGGYPRAASPAYYPVDSGEELSRALGTIAGLVSTCYFSVTPAPKSSAEIIAVNGDTAPIPADSANGWTFVSTVTSAGIQLNGTSCDDYRNGTIKSVRVNLSCSTR
jgi:hypothetical protein